MSYWYSTQFIDVQKALGVKLAPAMDYFIKADIDYSSRIIRKEKDGMLAIWVDGVLTILKDESNEYYDTEDTQEIRDFFNY